MYTLLDYICAENLFGRVAEASNVLREGIFPIQVSLNALLVFSTFCSYIRFLKFCVVELNCSKLQIKIIFSHYFQEKFPNVVEGIYCHGLLSEIHFTDEHVKQQADLMLLNKGNFLCNSVYYV